HEVIGGNNAGSVHDNVYPASKKLLCGINEIKYILFYSHVSARESRTTPHGLDFGDGRLALVFLAVADEHVGAAVRIGKSTGLSKPASPAGHNHVFPGKVKFQHFFTSHNKFCGHEPNAKT